MTRRVALLWLIFAAFACGAEPRAAKSVAPAPAPAPPPDERLPRLVPGGPAGDALWQRAAAGDSIDRLRLADREGAAGLLEGVERGGTQGLVALEALPHADDAELALGRLCELAERLQDEGRRPVLSALGRVIARLEPDRERLAGHALAACAAALDRMLKRPELPPAEHDLVSASRAALGEYVEPSPAP